MRVVKTKLNNAVKDASQYFKREWKEAIGAPISVISEQFSHLKTGHQDVVVNPRVPEGDVALLHNHLKEIDPSYSSAIMTKEHLSKTPLLVAYMDSHCLVTPYSFSIQKCNNKDCCAALCSPAENEIRDLVMQR